MPDAQPATADASSPDRSVAVTFDDLPGAIAGGPPVLRSVTDRLLGHIQTAGVPAIGFVNEEKLARPGEEAERTALLERWLEAGMELGNHTYSHPSLYHTPLAEYQSDVLRGERVTRGLLAERGMRPPRYFRHPFLNTGPDLETKEAFERFLAEHGYIVAPVTIDNDDWLYAAAYTEAAARSDSTLMRRIGEDYVRYMGETFDFHERLSQELLEREPAQVLLLHANLLNADYFDELAAMMRERGYRFVSLQEALKDPVYQLSDRYTGPKGISWLQRWAITQGKEEGEPPSVPQWVRAIAQR
ncbi:MAG TPA: polysaccharide deacetylase family protein [Longimicrobiaceae bacterium]|nr:polysaccharide deacetylase family protein [Longimicrobiaceae bacterium]